MQIRNLLLSPPKGELEKIAAGMGMMRSHELMNHALQRARLVADNPIIFPDDAAQALRETFHNPQIVKVSIRGGVRRNSNIPLHLEEELRQRGFHNITRTPNPANTSMNFRVVPMQNGMVELDVGNLHFLIDDEAYRKILHSPTSKKPVYLQGDPKRKVI